MKGSSHFASVPSADTQRSKFPRPSRHVTTMDANLLIPVFVDEVLPGDTFNMKASAFGRLATPLKPAMDNVYVDQHYFFVPSRLLWDNWEKFMGAQDNPGDSTDFLIPQIDYTPADRAEHQNSIYDYMGIPYVNGTISFSALPFRAYNLIYNEWYRDQNLIDSEPFEKGDSDTTEYKILKRGKRHDYFTSSLPFPQKGDPVSLSLAGTLPVEPETASTSPTLRTASQGTGNLIKNSGDNVAINNAAGSTGDPNLYWVDSGLKVDLDEVTAVTINQLRQAFQLQKFLERDARSGTRYIEVIKAHFNVTNPDFRLQRPEYLGGKHTDLNMTTVVQTSGALGGIEESPQGNLAAMGTVAESGTIFNKSFTEHGYIIGIASAYADLTYQQGLNKMWSRETRVDFYWPSFAHLGEQAILNKEIYAQGTADDDLVFGYQERYAEYRYAPSRISGTFRSDADGSLDIWHYSEDFANLPVLSKDFIENAAPIKRNSAVPTEPDFIFDFQFDLTCVRPMPMYGTPGFVDHF